MKITFVIQRYGTEVLGGAETLAREVAERLAGDFEVEVLTSCAQDHMTWKNDYEPGETELNGVKIRRFLATEERAANFASLYTDLANNPHTLDEEADFIKAQGPLVPGLLEHLATHGEESDLFIFIGYLYYPSAFGLHLVADRALLVPTAHDEPPIYFDIFKRLFHAPRALFFSTEGERRFVHGQFANRYIPNAVVGMGVDVPATPCPDRFREKMGLSGPYFLYLGQILAAKGCAEMVDYFQQYRTRYPDEASLLLLGKKHMELPDLPGLIYGGFVSEEDKYDAIAGAEAVVVPSRFESLSIISLEAWSLGRPVVCPTYSPVVSDLCRRSNGGLCYRDAAEFSEILHFLVTEKEIAGKVGAQGRAFVQSTYNWDRVLGQYRSFIDTITGQPWR